MAKSNCMLVFNIAVLQPLLWPLGQYAFAAQVIDLFLIWNIEAMGIHFSYSMAISCFLKGKMRELVFSQN